MLSSDLLCHAEKSNSTRTLTITSPGFCAGCIAAGPDYCALAGNLTAAQLEASIYSLLFDLKFNPIPFSVPGVADLLITYTIVKKIIVSNLDFPTFQWVDLTGQLAAIMSGNVSYFTMQPSEGSASESTAPVSDAEAMYGIKSSDVSQRSSLDEVLPIIEARHERSRVGGDSADHTVMRTARWRMTAKEIYKGNWSMTTSFPLLMIGNTYDFVTPLVSAKNASSGFAGSVVLQHDGYGHCTHLSQASLCTGYAIRCFFVNGTLPPAGTVCKVDEVLFKPDQYHWYNVTEQLWLEKWCDSA